MPDNEKKEYSMDSIRDSMERAIMEENAAENAAANAEESAAEAETAAQEAENAAEPMEQAGRDTNTDTAENAQAAPDMANTQEQTAPETVPSANHPGRCSALFDSCRIFRLSACNPQYDGGTQCQLCRRRSHADGQTH